VVGDDRHAIGSGPGVPDGSTWADARAALWRYGGEAHLSSVRAIVDRGVAGEIADTPAPGHPAVSRAIARVIGSRADAMAGAAEAARQRGYDVVVFDEAVTGEARVAAPDWLSTARLELAHAGRPTCVVSSGETTVTVTGSGTGGRNLEFGLSVVEAMSSWPSAAMASIGTDGIDGSSGVAGAIVDSTTLARARQAGIAAPGNFLAANNSFAYFAPLGDVVRLGRTDTNVGDLQVLLID
jgi:hydroxypyruvate reductase